MKAFIIVDLQNDFLTGGKLQIENSHLLIDKINKKILSFNKKEWLTVSTMDYHPFNHCSFLNNGGQWPKHCVKFTKGARLHRDLIKCDYNIKKGNKKQSDSYSGFYISENNESELSNILQKNRISEVYVCGLAFDVCVLNTCIDAIKFGYKVHVITDLSKSVNQKMLKQTKQKYLENGIKLIEEKIYNN